MFHGLIHVYTMHMIWDNVHANYVRGIGRERETFATSEGRQQRDRFHAENVSLTYGMDNPWIVYVYMCISDLVIFPLVDVKLRLTLSN